MKVNCLSCGYKVDLDDAYGDYEGQIKCFACGALLEIKTGEGNIKSIKFANLAGSSVEERLDSSS